MNTSVLNLVSHTFEKGTYTGIVYANIATTGTVQCNIALDVTQGTKKYDIGPPDGPIVTVN